MNNQKNIISWVILIFLVSTLFIIGLQSALGNYKFIVQQAIELDEGWSYRLDGGDLVPIDSLPYRIEVYDHETYSIEQTLSDVFQKQQQVLIRTSLANVEVKLGGVVIYEANFEDELTYASTWHIFEIPQNSQGKVLELTFSTPYEGMRGIVNEVYYGYLSSLYIHITSEFGIRMLVGLVTFIIGLGILVITLFFRKENYEMMYLGVSAMIFSLWLVAESRMLQFFMGNPNIIGGLAYISIALAPVPLALYVGHALIRDFKRFYFIASGVFFLNTLLVMVLHYTGTVSFFESVPISIVLLIIGLIGTIVFLIFEYKKYQLKSILTTLIIFSLVAIFTFFEVAVFSQSNFTQTANFVAIGLGFILIFIFVGYVRFSLNIYKASLERSTYEKLAYTDQLTGARNRFAYFKDVGELETSENPVSRYFVYLDIDKLKLINDRYGHTIGDYAIQSAYDLMKETFGKHGKCYRMGGDEFVCIIESESIEDVQIMIRTFEERCNKFNASAIYKFCVSVGVAKFESHMDKSVDEVLSEADKQMYVHKQSKR